MLRRNGAGQETMESVRKREGSLEWKGLVEQEGFEPGVIGDLLVRSYRKDEIQDDVRETCNKLKAPPRGRHSRTLLTGPAWRVE